MSLKILPNISSPEDIRSFSNKELADLCTELRSYTIETITEIGGHLAPTLGVIELTVALHYVFNTPRDKLVWDVGHQGYAHKLLTGRFEEFPTSTIHIDNFSEFLCLSTDNTLPNIISLTFNEQSIKDSTSKPPMESFSDNSSGVVFISTKSFNQLCETFIDFILLK